MAQPNFFTKNKRPLIIVSVLAALVIGVVIIARASKKPDEEPSYNPDVPQGGGSTPDKAEPKAEAIFPLTSGKKNDYVGKLQAYLNKKYKASLDVDNIFGPLTLAALKKNTKLSFVTQAWYDKNVK